MGNCVTPVDSDGGKASRKIDKVNLKDHKTDQAFHKILLLGPGESGKSTFLKQLEILYTENVHPERYVEVVYENVLTSIKILIDEQQKQVGKDPSYCFSTSGIDEAKAAIDEIPFYGPHLVDEQTARHVALLWSDPAIKLANENRSALQIPDTCSYFFDRVDEIGADRYAPSYEDITRCTFRTTGIKEVNLTVQSGNFTVVDVGGQRNERSKWIHCFEHCSGVIFFGAISEYDQVLREDYQVNRLEETFKLFEEISNSRWFKDCTMLLFLNKIDLFREKLKKKPLNELYPDFTGGDNYEEACKFLKDMFENKCVMKNVYTNFTSVIDGSSIKQLFETLADLVLRMHLERANLL